MKNYLWLFSKTLLSILMKGRAPANLVKKILKDLQLSSVLEAAAYFGLQSLRFNSIFANLDRGYLPLSNEVILHDSTSSLL